MFLLNGNPLSLDTPFTIDGTSYPANWLRLTSLSEKQAVGIEEVADVTTTYNDQFYWGVDNPKDLDGLKTQWTDQVKDTASKLLAATDWMVIRKVERNIDIPAETVTYRADVLTECDRLTTAIAAASNVEDLITAVSNQSWQ